MARRRVKRGNNRNGKTKDTQIESQQAQFIDPHVERQAAAIRAVRDVEVEHLLTELRLLRSYFNKEQLQKPVLRIFEEVLPNLSVVNDRESNKFELRWNGKDNNRMSMSCAESRDVHASLLQRLSLAFPDFSSAMPHLDGFEFPSNAGRTSLLGSDNLHFKDFSLEEPTEAQALAMQEALRTPGVSSQRLSVGMTPKTLRLPKPGEMLLSVHGSPLGVFKENNMEAICESEEG